MAITRTMAIDRAVDIIKAGLSSGSIKLKGSDYSDASNDDNIRNDSVYINGLINSISENILTGGKRPD